MENVVVFLLMTPVVYKVSKNIGEGGFRSLEWFGLLQIEVMNESRPKIRAVLCWIGGCQVFGVDSSQNREKKRVKQHHTW